VANLFHPVPARRKFLKSDSTEAAHIIQCVRFYALAHPEVAFTLIEDGRTIFQSPPCRSLLERVAAIFGRQTAEALLPVEARGEGMRLTGLIGKPGASRATRHEMITFVNRRPVDTKTLAYALIESYQQHLPKGRYPLAFLFLEIEPAAVDVNVHPAKREVRFRHEPGVRTFVVRSLLDALRNAAGDLAAALPPGAQRVTPLEPLPSAVRPPVASLVVPKAAPLPAIVLPQPSAAAPVPFSTEPLARPVPAIAPVLVTTPAAAAATPGAAEVASIPDAIPGEGRPGALAGWRHLGAALGGECEIFETPAGVVLLDRRAALERVLFEQLQREFRAGTTLSQRLLFAVPVELDPIAAALLADQLTFLAQHGLEVSAFGRNFFRIESAPAWLDPAEAEPFLRDILARLREGQLDPRRPNPAREELARLAAARAVRGGARADTGPELAARLLGCDQPLLTPGGRPTLIELSRGELTRRFQKDRC
jgi:DNA mismatch repair protein MutL